jgi:hypothetical protein
MADTLKAEGLVIAAMGTGNNVYPFACATNSSITISGETLEIATISNNSFRSFVTGRQSFTVSGSGLAKMTETSMNGINFFDNFITGTNTKFKCFLDLIDNQNNYQSYEFYVIITSLTLDSTYGSFPTYSYTLQGASPITDTLIRDQDVVASGKVTAAAGSEPGGIYKLVAVGYGGKWYFNYTVTLDGATPIINLGSALNGTTVTHAYTAI